MEGLLSTGLLRLVSCNNNIIYYIDLSAVKLSVSFLFNCLSRPGKHAAWLLANIFTRILQKLFRNGVKLYDLVGLPPLDLFIDTRKITLENCIIFLNQHGTDLIQLYEPNQGCLSHVLRTWFFSFWTYIWRSKGIQRKYRYWIWQFSIKLSFK